MIRRIRENVVVLINPVSNPDGRDKQVEWFYRYLKGKTDLASLPRQAPPYWSKYAYVDINRDAHQLVHETTKAVFRMFFDWHPQMVHDLHESVALLVTWNGTGPINEHVDPLTYAERLELSFHEVQAMTGLGMPGVWTWNFGDDWAHLYLDAIGTNHNADGRGYETFGNGTAETLRAGAARHEISVEWYRPLPPPAQKSFLWSARDNVNYNETGMLAALDYMAQQSKTLLQQLLPQGPAFVQARTRGSALRDPDSRRAGRSRSASRRWLRACCPWASRCTAPPRRYHAEGGHLPGRHLRRAPRPALPRLRGGPAHSAAVSEGSLRRGVRRCFLGAARALPPRGGRRPPTRRCAPPTSRATAGGAAGAGSGCRGRAGVPPEGHRPGGTARGTLRARALQGRDRRAGIQRKRHRLPGGIVDSCAAGRVWPRRCDDVAGRLGLDFVSTASVPAGGEARDARTAAWAVGAVGGHRHDRLGALHARPAAHTVRLRARRGHPRRQAQG